MFSLKGTVGRNSELILFFRPDFHLWRLISQPSGLIFSNSRWALQLQWHNVSQKARTAALAQWEVLKIDGFRKSYNFSKFCGQKLKIIRIPYGFGCNSWTVRRIFISSKRLTSPYIGLQKVSESRVSISKTQGSDAMPKGRVEKTCSASATEGHGSSYEDYQQTCYNPVHAYLLLASIRADFPKQQRIFICRQHYRYQYFVNPFILYIYIATFNWTSEPIGFLWKSNNK